MESEQPDPKPQPPVNSLSRAGTRQVSAFDYSIEAKSAQATESHLAPGPFRHLLGFAIGYAVILFFCALGLGDSVAPVFPLAACVYSTVFLVALWSVFGPGTYLKRLFWAHLFGLIPVLALMLGVFIRVIGQWNASTEIWYVSGMMLISLVPVSLGAQLPFWFFRGLFGWQLVFRGDQPERSFELRDVFVLTFVFALCFAVPQTAANLGSGMGVSGDYYDAGEMTITEVVLQPDGSYIEVDRVMTAEESSNQRRQRQLEYQRENQMMTYALYGAYVLYVSVISLLSVPIVLFVFHARETASGCGLTGLYVFGIWGIPTVIFTVVFGGALEEYFVYFGLLLGLFAGAAAVPMMVSRETGFQLTSPKRFALERLKAESQFGNSEVEAPAET